MSETKKSTNTPANTKENTDSLKELLSLVFSVVDGMVPPLQALILTYARVNVSKGTFKIEELKRNPISMVCDGPFLFTCIIHEASISAFNMEKGFALIKSIGGSSTNSLNSLTKVYAVTVCQGFILIADDLRVMMFDARKPPLHWTFLQPYPVGTTILDISATDGFVCVLTNTRIDLYEAVLMTDRSRLQLSFQSFFWIDRPYSCGLFLMTNIDQPNIFVINQPLHSSSSYSNHALQILRTNYGTNYTKIQEEVGVDVISISSGRVYIRDILTSKKVFVFNAATGQALPSIILPEIGTTVTVTDDGRWLLYWKVGRLPPELTVVPLDSLECLST